MYLKQSGLLPHAGASLAKRNLCLAFLRYWHKLRFAKLVPNRGHFPQIVGRCPTLLILPLSGVAQQALVIRAFYIAD